jgi:hypothetical protein
MNRNTVTSQAGRSLAGQPATLIKDSLEIIDIYGRILTKVIIDGTVFPVLLGIIRCATLLGGGNGKLSDA